jgi:mutator protein MutT
MDVVAGVVFRGSRLLIAQRRWSDHLGGHWEFPGGKVLPGEGFEAGLMRELQEELGIEVEVGGLIEELTHAYPERVVRLWFYRCRWVRHEPQALGCEAFAWVTRSGLRSYRFPPADERLLVRLETDDLLWGAGESGDTSAPGAFR